MVEVPERLRFFEERTGLRVVGVVPVREATAAVAGALPTMADAARLFELVAARLGERAFADPEGGARRRRLHLREAAGSPWLCAWPLYEVFFDGHHGRRTFELGPPGPAPRPALDLAPRGPDMRPGIVTLAEGAARFEWRFDERGLRIESSQTSGDGFTACYHGDSRPYAVDPLARDDAAPPVTILCRADVAEAARSLEALAAVIAASAPAVPARVRAPATLPGGVQGAWLRAAHGLREALLEERVPADAGWVVADGYAGRALGHGATREEAFERWLDAIAREPPRPPRAGPEDELAARRAAARPDRPPAALTDASGRVTGFDTGTVRIEIPAVNPELDWPADEPGNVPAAAVPLPPLPAEVPAAFAAAGFERWVRLLGRFGQVQHALRRDEPGRLTLVGEGIIDLVDPAALAAELDDADARRAADLREVFGEQAPASPGAAQYRCWDAGRRARVPFELAEGADRLVVRDLDGDRLRHRVLRARTG